MVDEIIIYYDARSKKHQAILNVSMYQIVDNVERNLRKTDCDYHTAVRLHVSELYFHEQAVVTGQRRSSRGTSYYASNLRTLHLLLDTEQNAYNEHTSSK